MEEEEYKPSDELLDVVNSAIEHGIKSVNPGTGTLVPFLMTVKSGQRTIGRLDSLRIEDAVEQAKLIARRLGPDVERYAIGYGGYVMVDGKRREAIIIESEEIGAPSGVSYSQPYKKAGFLKKTLKPDGAPGFMGEIERRMI